MPDELDGPPEGASSRRDFSVLYDVGHQLIETLSKRFTLTVEHTDLELHGARHPAVCMKPSDSKASPITIFFTSFPGLVVWYGHWHELQFPSIAEADDASALVERLHQWAREISEKPLVEALTPIGPRPLAREAWVSEQFGYRAERFPPWSPRIGRGGKTRVGGPVLKSALASHSWGRQCWKPWPRVSA